MNELNKINNEALLGELSKRLNKGEIKLEGDRLVGKTERENNYVVISLNINVGNLVSQVIRELKEEKRLLREDKERFELELKKLQKQLETLKAGNQSS